MKRGQSPLNYPVDHGTPNFGTILQGGRSNSSRIKSGSSPLKNGFPSRPSGAKSGPAFLRLDADIFLLVADHLEVRDIIALSQVSQTVFDKRFLAETRSVQTCKVLSQKSMDHSLWSAMALNKIISKKLPWPSYAWPLSQVPTATLEQLCIRAVQMATKWDTRRLGNDIKHCRFIQRPWNSITWMAMFRSRWLLIQLNARQLELWDLSRPFTSVPISYFDGLDDIVDGYKLLSTCDDSLTITLSLR